MKKVSKKKVVTKKRNAQDLTLRNLRALHKKLDMILEAIALQKSLTFKR